MMKTPIRNIQLDTSCDKIDLKRNSCKQDYYCTICNKTVIDFRLKNKQELEKEILQSDSYVCGIFNQKQVYRKVLLPKFLTGILMALGLNLLFKESHAQKADTLTTHKDNIVQEDVFVGTFEIMPVYKNGGEEGLRKFLSENIVYPDSLKESGKVVIEFTIDTAGVVRNMKLVKGFNEYADKEALRVCSLLVFTPGYRYGKPIETKFYLPIKFAPPADRNKPKR